MPPSNQNALKGFSVITPKLAQETADKIKDLIKKQESSVSAKSALKPRRS